MVSDIRYLLGTDDGVVHKCSVSFNDQYLSNYLGHAVYLIHTNFNMPPMLT